ncbi:AAA family ATPase [Caulobacter hibisci]|uniref:AAA family ATPase n=1 Tax=Caulobacter hibisci TaxID=2035993 RepID=A0ABS0T216_9CAUL|nr:AAA family ATPase [Caulobacter hibisci]MBI1685915.1 AAA family ATPase [Caulobacter hibisci]
MPEVKPEAYRVVFSKGGELDAVQAGTIVITTGHWNDFGRLISIKARIHPRVPPFDDVPIVLKGFVAFINEKGVEQDTTLLDQFHADPLHAEDLPPFFTMLTDLSAYRWIVQQLGPQEAREVLASIHDLVLADEATQPPYWHQQALGSTLFQEGFLRTSQAYFAWKNAGPILRGLIFEEVNRISQALAIEFQLAGRPNAHRLSFQFASSEDVLPKRFAVVIGKNGVGKSQALGRIAKAALTGSHDLTGEDGERPAFNRLLAFSTTQVSASVFPSDRRLEPRIWYKRFSLQSNPGRRGQPTSDLIVQLARSEERIAGRSRFQIFLSALRAIEGAEEIALPARNGARFVPVDGLIRGGEQAQLTRFASIITSREPVRVIDGKPYPLSSGELAFVRFAALASLHIENGTLMLLDEPETHLHPNFISQFVALLDSLLEQTGSLAIIATHSVYFVREAFEDQVQVLRSNADREISVETPILKTFGADVGVISFFVFGETQPSRLAAEVERRISQAANSWEEAFERYRSELSVEALAEIRAQIEARLDPSRPA